MKPVSDDHFKIRKIKLENQEYEIKEIPTIPFRVNVDPLSEENAFDGIYDMIDIMGDDPSVTPAQLCHGHKVYRGVDLGVRLSQYESGPTWTVLTVDIHFGPRLSTLD